MRVDAAAARRLRRLVGADLAGMWGSVAALLVLDRIVGPDPAFRLNAAVLAGGGVLLLIGSACLQLARYITAAVLVTLASWIAAAGVTVVSPFSAPVGVAALLLPVVLFFEFLSPRLLARFLVVTVAATGALAGLGEYLRRDEDPSTQPVPALAVGVLLVFMPVVVGVIAIGLVHHAQRLTDQAAALVSSQRRLASASYEARRAIERDLHDGAQQRLSTLSVRLGRATRLARDDPQEAQRCLVEAQHELRDAIRELRDLAHGIYPALLEQRGLAAALSAAARRSTVPCTVHADGVDRYPPFVENAVYFCCLEAMHNADKHSGASAVRVEVTDEGDAVSFTVADDGVGFDPAATSGVGVTGLVDRARAAGGELILVAAPGRGTRIDGRIPCS